MEGSDEDSPLLLNSSPRRSIDSNNTAYTSDSELAIVQATVFIEDGIHYRSIHHKIDCRSEVGGAVVI